MTPPDAPAGWKMSYPDGQTEKSFRVVPGYERADGWKVVVRGSSDIQIGWTYWPKVTYNGIEANIPGCGWGPGAISACLTWVDENFPQVKHEPTDDRLKGWHTQVLDFLHHVAASERSEKARDALFLLAGFPQQPVAK